MTTQTTTHNAIPNSIPTPAALQATVAQEQLKRALTRISHAVAPKSVQPILSHLLLASDGTGRLRLSATNLEIGITTTLPATVTQPGAITLPARLLLDVVGGLPSAPIGLAMDARAQSVTLTCGCFAATIKGMDAEEFPAIPSSSSTQPAATLAPEALCAAVAQVAFAAASDETRPVLTGVRIALRGSVASFVAADTFRLAFRDIALDAPVEGEREIIVPARAMMTLGKILADAASEVQLRIDGGDRVIFRTDELELVARAIDGRYPTITPYRELRAGTVLEIGTRELARAVKLASFFATTSANIVRLTLAPDTDSHGLLTLAANAAEVGENISQHSATVCGPGGVLALNVAFLADGLAAIATPTVALHYSSAQQPILLRGVGDESYTYVAMPMTVR